MLYQLKNECEKVQLMEWVWVEDEFLGFYLENNFLFRLNWIESAARMSSLFSDWRLLSESQKLLRWVNKSIDTISPNSPN